MKQYMLDTNMVSYLFRENQNVIKQLLSKPISSICISAITEAELVYGLAKRPEAKRLRLIVDEFLQRVDVLPWSTHIAKRYGPVRAKLEQQGYTLSSMDLLIATHALDVGAILVSHDLAFKKIPGLRLEDWTSH